MTPDEKRQKSALKNLYKKMLQAHAHIVLLQTDSGEVKMYTNIDAPKDIAYTLTYVANDLLGKADEFEQLVMDKAKEQIKEAQEEQNEEMAEYYEQKEKEQK